MMSIRRCAMLACLMPFAVLAEENQPPDVYAAIVSHRVRHSGAADAFSGTTRALLEDLLVTPDSPFSDVNAQPSITNAEWWESMSVTLFPQATDAMQKTLEALHVQMGLTKARPGVEYQVDPQVAALYRGAFPAAQALKAGVDADIFWQARTLNPAKSTEAAEEAVALQILRDQVLRNDASTHVEKLIRRDVLDRYMRYYNTMDVLDEDRGYLRAVLQGAMSSRPPSYEAGGLPSGLPTIYRVVRIAAAYADAAGYNSFTPGATCVDARPPQEPGDPFCFAAATDRSVRAWYRRERLRQEVRHENPRSESAFAKLVHLLTPLLFVLDGVAFIELAEEAIASDLLADAAIEEDEAVMAAERADNLTCRIHR